VTSETGAARPRLTEVPGLRRPDSTTLFVERAERLETLAQGNAIGDYLRMLAALARAQDVAVRAEAASPIPPDAWPDELGETLTRIVGSLGRELASVALPDAARRAVAELGRWSGEALVVLARRVARGDVGLDELAPAPFVAAAAQVHHVRRAAAVHTPAPTHAEPWCPGCGSSPVAGIVLGDDKLRFLVCSLCATGWHATRVTCSRCGTTAGISYLSVDGGDANVKAETCEACHAYLKHFYLEGRPETEPLADDAATWALDDLVGERGYGRVGVNPFLLAARVG
jgi:FdhE protein